MPPWKADPADGPFVGQHPLSDVEILLLQRWVDEGAAEGDPRDAPSPRVWTEGWQLGKPDLVVTLPQPYTLPAEGTDVFRIFVIPIPVDATTFVRGLEEGGVRWCYTDFFLATRINFLSDERDLKLLVKGAQVQQRIIESQPFDRFRGEMLYQNHTAVDTTQFQNMNGQR